MGGVGLSLARFFLVVCSFKISKALTFTISRAGVPMDPDLGIETEVCREFFLIYSCEF